MDIKMAIFMGPRRLVGRSSLHETFRSKSLAGTIALLVSGCGMRHTSERPVAQAPLVAPVVALGQDPAPTDLGDGTHVVVARGTVLFADMERKKPVFSVARRENVVFRRGQTLRGSVEITTANAESGTCHRDLDGFDQQDLRFWVSPEDLVAITTQDTDLGMNGKWQVVAHPGAEIVEGFVVYNTYRAAAPQTPTALSFTPRTPQGSWGTFPEMELETPMRVSKTYETWDAKNVKSTYVTLDHATFSETSMVIDHACFTLARTLDSASPADQKMANVLGSGGLGMLDSLMGTDSSKPVHVSKGAAITWQDRTVAGRSISDIWIYDGWRDEGRVCGEDKLPADANVAADSVVLCYDDSAVIP